MSKLSRAIFIQLMVLVGLVPASVLASTLTVGSSGADYTSISAAISAANSGDVIVLAAETFTEAGLTVSDKSLSFKGQGASSTIVQAASSYNTATDRVFSLSFGSYSTSNIVSFEDMTIRYGKKAAAPGGQGGGIAATATVLKIIDCELNSNIAATTSGGYYGEGGGAVWLSSSDLEASGSTFDGNSHTSSFTGDMEGGGAIAFYCNDNLNYMTITNCTFSDNSAGNKGGAIMARPPITNAIQITNSTFHGNSAALGGAYMTAGSGANPQPIYFKNTILSGNTASNAGSQVYSTETTNFTFTNSLIQSTSAGNLGGVYTDCIIGSDPLLSALADNGGPTRTMLVASGSPVIDAGTSSGAPSVDQRGYNRNGATDIGAFEFNGIFTIPQMDNPLAAGDAHNLFRKSDGSLHSWGLNAEGQLGDASLTSSSFPVSVDMSGVLAGKTLAGVVSGEAFSLALTTDGGLYSWGRNIHGQLGNGTTVSSSVPVAVNMSGALSGKTIVALAAGSYHALALASDGTVYGWGHNAEGELGNNSTASSTVPVAVNTSGVLNGKTVTAIAAGNTHSLALASDGNLYSWGGNAHGVLGNNSTSTSLVPVAVLMNGVLSGKTVTDIASAYLHNVVLASDGTVYTWGAGVVGELGNGPATSSSVPVAVSVSGVLSGKTVTAIATGLLHSMALTSDGNLYSWGDGTNGQLGNGANTQANVPVSVDMTGVLAGKTLTDIDAGYFHNIVLDSDGALYTWGKNDSGQLGNASNTSSNVPVAVTFIVPPLAATYLTPTDASTDSPLDVLIQWELSDGAAAYYFNLGTDNPPTNVSQLNLSAESNFFQDPSLIDYSTTYYWSVTPHNLAGNASGVQVWSFTTMAQPNDAPVFTSTPITSVMDNEQYGYSIETSDANDDVVSISATQIPDWLTLTSGQAGNVTTIASGGNGFLDGPVATAKFVAPSDAAVDMDGNVYISDTFNHRIRKISPEGIVSTLAGSVAGYADGQGSEALFAAPWALDVDADGNVYVADSNNGKVRKVTPEGVVTTLASIPNPSGVTVAPSGIVYVSTTYNIQQIELNGTVSLLAGSGAGSTDGQGSAASFFLLQRMDTDASGNIYVADQLNNKIRKITPAGLVTTHAGDGTYGYQDGPAANAQFKNPSGVVVDQAGNVLVADQGNNRIRKIAVDGTVTTVAGNGNATAVDGDLTSASFNGLYGLGLDASGNIYVAGYNSHLIRFVEAGGTQLTGNPAGHIGTHAVSLTADDGNGGTATQAFTIEVVSSLNPPLAATNPNPADDATGVILDHQISWAESATASGYVLSMGTSAGATDIVNALDLAMGEEYVVIEGVVTFTNTPSWHAYGTEYFWTVVPYNAAGQATGAVEWSYTTVNPVPDVDVTLTPIEGSELVAASGGRIHYEVMLENTTAERIRIRAKIIAMHSDGTKYGPLGSTPITIILDPNEMISRQLTQVVPGRIPSGEYTFYCIIGNAGNTRIDSAGFTATKQVAEQLASSHNSIVSRDIVGWNSLYTDNGAQALPNDLWTIEGSYREDGSLVTASTLAVGDETLPENYSLSQNYPNPFNPSTTIKFALQTASDISLKIYDINGAEVAQVARGHYEAGYYSFNFSPQNLSSGTYLYVLEAGSFREVKRLVYLK